MDNKKLSLLKEKVKGFPDSPGVYLMTGKKGEVLYVGKANSLRSRVKSYFLKNLPIKTEKLIEQVEDIEYVKCQSEEQALLLEAALIKEKKPKYNIALRDDKSYPYVIFTQEIFSRVGIARVHHKGKGVLLGPFTQSKLIKGLLALIRKVFPYRSCLHMPKKACLYYHLNLCPAPCEGKISLVSYKETIQRITQLLLGQRKLLVSQLKKKMDEFVASQNFEKAAKVRDTLTAIEALYLGKSNVHVLVDLQKMLNLEKIPLLIEAIDVSNLSGSNATGAVVVFKEGVPANSLYRRYKIKTVSGIDDYAMIKEVVRRRYQRLLQEKKSLPDLVIIDGGKGHLACAKEEVVKLGLSLVMVGLAKHNEEIWQVSQDKPLIVGRDNPALQLLQRLRDEAHRFCRNYHLLRRSNL